MNDFDLSLSAEQDDDEQFVGTPGFCAPGLEKKPYLKHFDHASLLLSIASLMLDRPAGFKGDDEKRRIILAMSKKEGPFAHVPQSMATFASDVLTAL